MQTRSGDAASMRRNRSSLAASARATRLRSVRSEVTPAIRTARPDDGLLSEEEKDNPARLAKNRVWIVDPVDGTREFSEGRGDWAVHVALSVGGAPVLGRHHTTTGGDHMLAHGLGIGEVVHGGLVWVERRRHVRRRWIRGSS